MAGDWIKVETNTPMKPEVWEMAELLGLDPDAVVGKLVRFWSWADSHLGDSCNALRVTASHIDKFIATPGFSDALKNVGWLQGEDRALILTNFDRHNGKTAKTRSLTAKRVASHRNGNATVTPAALQMKRECNEPPLAEKRREEYKEGIAPEARPTGIPATEQAAVEAVAVAGVPPDFAIELWHSMEGVSWVDGAGRKVTKWPSFARAAFNRHISRQAERSVRLPGKNGAKNSGVSVGQQKFELDRRLRELESQEDELYQLNQPLPRTLTDEIEAVKKSLRELNTTQP